MDATPLSLDSSPDAERRLVEGWRAMSAEQKLAIVVGMSRAVRELAFTGIRQRYPDAGPREQRLRYARLTLGDELASAAYPEVPSLDRP